MGSLILFCVLSCSSPAPPAACDMCVQTTCVSSTYVSPVRSIRIRPVRRVRSTRVYRVNRVHRVRRVRCCR